MDGRVLGAGSSFWGRGVGVWSPARLIHIPRPFVAGGQLGACCPGSGPECTDSDADSLTLTSNKVSGACSH